MAPNGQLNPTVWIILDRIEGRMVAMTKQAECLTPTILLITAALIALACPMLLAQTTPALAAPSSPTPIPTTNATPAPSFDVATIKPHPGMVPRMALKYQPDGFTGTESLAMLVEYAYGVRADDQVSGVPDWAKEAWFDIQVKLSAADFAEMLKMSQAEINDRYQLMMQALLAERFKLKVHSETKQVKVYELVVAKGSSQLKDSATDPNPPLGKGEDGKPSFGIRWLKDTTIVQSLSMANLARFLSRPVFGVGRPVLDKTGLTSTYDYTLNWSIYSASAAASNSPTDDTTSIFTALGEIGLKLQPSTGPIDILVIDHVEHPTEN